MKGNHKIELRNIGQEDIKKTKQDFIREFRNNITTLRLRIF